MANESTDALKLAEAVVDKLYDHYQWIGDSVDRQNVHVGVARWTGRNGVCKYNKRLDEQRFGERMTSLPHEFGEHAIVINERILNKGNRAGFIDTVQHELAHVLCYAEDSKYPSGNPHGAAWKEMAERLGADPSSCHNKRDRSDEYEYYLVCNKCGKEWGKTKRSKTIKQPFNYRCSCGHKPLSSYETGQDRPERDGVVAVESIPWDNRSQWNNRKP